MYSQFVFRLHSESRPLCCTWMHKLTAAVLLAILMTHRSVSMVSVSGQTALHRLQAESADTVCSLQWFTCICSFGTHMPLSCYHDDDHMNIGVFCLCSN